MDDVIGLLRAAGERTRPPEPFDLDAVVRGGESRRRRRRAGAGVVAIVAAVAVSMGATAVWQHRSTDMTVSAGTAQEQLALLTEPRQPGDQPSAALDVIAADLVEPSMRVVATTPEAEFWAAVDDDGQVCLVTVLPGPDWSAALSCATPADFAERGIPLTVNGPTGSVEAWLVADGYTPSAEDGEAWTFVTPNLAIGRPD